MNWRVLWQGRGGAVPRTALLLAILFLSQAPLVAQPAKAELQTRRTWRFADSDVWFSNEFSGARLNACTETASNEFNVVISPENTPINPSPWYAFQIGATRPRTVRVNLAATYEGNFLRPRLSTDGVHWKEIARERFTTDGRTHVATMTLDVGTKPLWVAAHELIGLRELNDWADAKSKLPFVHPSNVGASIEGRPLRQFTLAETTNRNYVFIIGRQHPPEVTGSIALMSFVDTLSGRSRLAKRFRKSFQTVVVPLMNPDGVAHGQWRSNLGGVDINRDWQPFTQPETRAVSSFLSALGQQPGARPFLFVDFHSTSSNVFYTQKDGEPMKPFDFARHWLERIHERYPGFQMHRDDGHNTGLATSKAWANATFQIPAITCELGSRTDREAIRRFGKVAAEEMMRLLLVELDQPFVTATPPPKPETVAPAR